MRTINALLLLLLLLPTAACAQPMSVRLEQTDNGWRLLRNGEPYFIKGAGGNREQDLDMLASIGANSIRTWGHGELEPTRQRDGSVRSILDVAHEKGLTVCAGFWAAHPEHGYDYTDPVFLERQREELRAFVRKWKHHPAILVWGVGNELALTVDPRVVFPEVNILAQIVKEEDPTRPIMHVVSGTWADKPRLFDELCPDVDIYGVNSYAGIVALREDFEKFGFTRPYVVTEYGPRGHWESGKTDWDAPIEQTSGEKADHYQLSYERGILDNPSQCLGGYVFLWGWKQERTETWYGMFTKQGLAMEVVDVMQRMWGGTPRANQAPMLQSFRCSALSETIAPGTTVSTSVRVEDPDGDDLSYTWVLKLESTDRRLGGVEEDEPKTIRTVEGGPRFRMQAPNDPGNYRLFVFVEDGQGNVATANAPFRVNE
ncbi:MAG: glycoside hydrolase family 2 TIM barrel-domain containing protein [Planctomycetota bacterium]